MQAVSSGVLLIASPVLADPNFMRTVVYVLEHTDGGTLGLIMNRPLDVPLGDLWDECPGELTSSRLCAEGGPVDRHKGLLLHGYTELEDTYQLADGIAVGGDPQELHQRSLDDAERSGPRLFLGHAGWQPSQLEDEIAIGSWLVRRGHPILLLNPSPPEDLWQDLVTSGGDTPGPSSN
jgi:putative transcriptional regulator